MNSKSVIRIILALIVTAVWSVAFFYLSLWVIFDFFSESTNFTDGAFLLTAAIVFALTLLPMVWYTQGKRGVCGKVVIYLALLATALFMMYQTFMALLGAAPFF